MSYALRVLKPSVDYTQLLSYYTALMSVSNDPQEAVPDFIRLSGALSTPLGLSHNWGLFL